MESPPQPVAPPRPRTEEARQMIDRAERTWRHQVVSEEMPVATGPRAAFRWLLLVIALGAIVFLMFERLSQLG